MLAIICISSAVSCAHAAPPAPLHTRVERVAHMDLLERVTECTSGPVSPLTYPLQPSDTQSFGRPYLVTL